MVLNPQECGLFHNSGCASCHYPGEENPIKPNSFRFLFLWIFHILTNDTFGCALTICSFSPSEIRVFGHRDGTARKKRGHARLAGIKMSRNPLQTCPFDGTRDTSGAETRPAGKPAGGFRRQNDTENVSRKKFQRERKTASEPPRKDFCTGIFSYEPRNKNSEPRNSFFGARNFAFRPRNFSPDRPKSKRH